MFLKVIKYCLGTTKVEELSKENLGIAPLLYRLTQHAHDPNSLYLLRLSPVGSEVRQRSSVLLLPVVWHHVTSGDVAYKG